MADNVCSYCGAPLRELLDGACPFCRVPVAPEGSATAPPPRADWAVVLVDAGRKKIEVIKAVRELTDYGLKEAKDLVEAADRNPAVIATGLDEALATAWVDRLGRAGAVARTQPAG